MTVVFIEIEDTATKNDNFMYNIRLIIKFNQINLIIIIW